MAKKAAPVKKPTDINHLLNGLGIVSPETNTPHLSSRNDVLQVANTLGSQRVATLPPPKTTKITPLTAPVWSNTPSPTNPDDGSAWSTIGDIFKKAITIVDTPRSYVESAVNQGARLIAGAVYGDGKALPEAHWDDFTKDASHHLGFQNYLKGEGANSDYTGPPKDIHRAGGTRRVAEVGLGFLGDVVMDPITYLSGGTAKGGEEVVKLAEGAVVKTAAENAAKDAGLAGIENALHAGGRNEVGKAVAAAAKGAGVEGTDQLVANAARRGAAALTAKGLEEAGIDAEKAASLGIPKQVYKFMGAEIPKSGLLAEAVANLKGSAKEALGESGAAKLVRKLRISDAFGERGFVDTIRAAGDRPAEQAAAVRALATVNASKAQTYGWLGQKFQELTTSGLGKTLTRGSKLEKDGLIAASEAEGEKTALNVFFDGVHKDLNELGVETPYRENYVPHILTPEARRLDTPEIQQITKSITDSAGFTSERHLNQTIAEANAEFMDKHGVKLFLDDPNKIIQSYLHSSQEAVGHSVQSKALVDAGIAVEQPEFATTARMAKDEVARVNKLKTKAEKAASKELSKTIETREGAAMVASESLKGQMKDLSQQIREVEIGTKNLARSADTAAAKVRVAETQLETLKSKLEVAVKAVKDERGGASSPAQTAARENIRSIEKQIETKTEALAAAKSNVHYIMTETQVNAGAKATASKGFVAETKRLGEEHAALTAEYANKTAALQQLKLTVNRPGAGPLLADLHVQEATAKVADMTEKLGKANSVADVTQGVYDMAVADKDAVINALDTQKGELQDIVKTLGTRKAPASLRGKAEYANVLSENLTIARGALESTDPAVQLLARMEATAAMSDVAAMTAISDVNKWDHMLGVLKDPKFRTYMEREVSPGFAKLNETYQIPDWAAQSLQSRNIFRAGEWEKWVKFYDKALNVTKGYMVARPGFVIRNMYSSLSSVYLEAGAGAIESLGTYRKFLKIWESHPEDFGARALAKWGDPELVDRLTNALHVAQATGGGQAASEVGVGFLTHGSLNPISKDFLPIKGIRAWNGNVEDFVRGGHAFDVLQRGGSTDLAVDTVTKWHFNYRDLTTFDQQAKRVMPFWTFFSRNMALQVENFDKILPKLNRTYFNLQRNLAVDMPPQNTPGYWDGSSPLRLGDSNYLFPDLPTLTAVNDLSNAVSSHGASMAAQLTPPLKVLLDNYSDRDAYSQIPFNDKPDNSPNWAQIPGLDLLPGVEQGGRTGRNVVTDRTQHNVENLLPVLGQGSRLGTTSGSNPNPVLSWLGISVRDNSPKMQASEAKAIAAKIAADVKRSRELANS